MANNLQPQRQHTHTVQTQFTETQPAEKSRTKFWIVAVALVENVMAFSCRFRSISCSYCGTLISIHGYHAAIVCHLQKILLADRRSNWCFNLYFDSILPSQINRFSAIYCISYTAHTLDSWFIFACAMICIKWFQPTKCKTNEFMEVQQSFRKNGDRITAYWWIFNAKIMRMLNQKSYRLMRMPVKMGKWIKMTIDKQY